MDHATNKTSISEFGGMMSLDTTFVLFFLAIEYGRGVRLFSVDGALMGTTMLMVLVLPYFLPSNSGRYSFSNWVAGRTAITILGMLIGVAFSWSLGSVLPEGLRFAPLAFLIVAAMISCFVQFYALMNLRPAK